MANQQRPSTLKRFGAPPSMLRQRPLGVCVWWARNSSCWRVGQTVSFWAGVSPMALGSECFFCASVSVSLVFLSYPMPALLPVSAWGRVITTLGEGVFAPRKCCLLLYSYTLVRVWDVLRAQSKNATNYSPSTEADETPQFYFAAASCRGV